MQSKNGRVGEYKRLLYGGQVAGGGGQHYTPIFTTCFVDISLL